MSSIQAERDYSSRHLRDNSQGRQVSMEENEGTKKNIVWS